MTPYGTTLIVHLPPALGDVVRDAAETLGITPERVIAGAMARAYGRHPDMVVPVEDPWGEGVAGVGEDCGGRLPAKEGC